MLCQLIEGRSDSNCGTPQRPWYLTLQHTASMECIKTLQIIYLGFLMLITKTMQYIKKQ